MVAVLKLTVLNNKCFLGFTKNRRFVTAHCFVTLLLPTVLLLCYCPLFCYFVTAHCFVTLLLPTVLLLCYCPLFWDKSKRCITIMKNLKTGKLKKTYKERLYINPTAIHYFNMITL